MDQGHKKEVKISIKKFKEILKRYPEEDIESTTHTLFRLSEGQRKIYEECRLKDYLIKEKPLEIIQQRNGNLSVLYQFKQSKKVIKIVLNIGVHKIYIVTFYILNNEQRKKIGK